MVRHPDPLPPARRSAGAEECDILLIQPPIRDFYLTAKRTMPYGLASIAAACRAKGYRVAIFDALATGKSRPIALPDDLAYLADIYGPIDVSPFALFHQYRHFGYALATIAEQARLSGARLIGISSLFSPYEDMALACAQAVKSECPSVPVVLGGHHPTAFPERLLDHAAVDFVLRGDGEACLPSLAEALLKNGDLESVPGLAHRRASGSYGIGSPVYVEDLNRLPPPAVDLVKERYYARKGAATLVIAASRGCPMSCSYCCMGARSRIAYRRRTVAHVMQEIAHAAGNRKIGLIDFEDENIALDRSWFADLLGEIRRYFQPHAPELRAMNGLFPAALDQRTIAHMQAAGFRELNLSLGTSDHRQAQRFRRPDLAAAFDRALGWAAQLNMTAIGYLIVGAPGQDPRTSLNDLLFLASRRALAGVSVYYPAPDSLDFLACANAGLLPASPRRWRSTALPIDHTTRRSESATLLRLARILNFMKQCVDEQGIRPLPKPSPYDGRPLSGPRDGIGRRLLSWFLEDGIVRGVRPNGDVFVQPTVAWMTRSFVKGIKSLNLRGVRH